MSSVATIANALDPHAVALTEVAERYPGPCGLVRRILGVLPNAVGYFEIWPPALVTYNLTIPALLDVPKCDMGMGIGPELRAMVAHAASLGFGCQYCTAHTAIMGTLVTGPVDGIRLSGRIAAVRQHGELRKPERAALEYAQAVAAVPSQATPEVLEALHASHKPARAEAIVLVACVMGYLNRFMDTLGTPLETAVHKAAGEALEAGGDWAAGKHDDTENSPLAEGVDLARPGRLGLLREVPAAVAYEKRALADVPEGEAQLDDKLRGDLGFLPFYFDRVRRRSARRIFAHWLLERLNTEGAEVPASLKHTMACIHARGAGNHLLAAHFAYLAVRAGAKVGDLQRQVRTPPTSPSSKAAAALAFAHATAGATTTISPELVGALCEEHTPASVVELLGVISIVCGLQRYVATYMPEAYEPEIAAFVDEHGGMLELPASPRLDANA